MILHTNTTKNTYVRRRQTSKLQKVSHDLPSQVNYRNLLWVKIFKTRQIWTPTFWEYPSSPHDYHLWSLSHFLAKSWADDLEDMDQGQKSYMTLLLVVITWTKYGNDSSTGRKVIQWARMISSTDRQWWPPPTMWVVPLYLFECHHLWCLNNPIFSNFSDVLHIEHVQCIIMNFGQPHWVIPATVKPVCYEHLYDKIYYR